MRNVEWLSDTVIIWRTNVYNGDDIRLINLKVYVHVNVQQELQIPTSHSISSFICFWWAVESIKMFAKNGSS